MGWPQFIILLVGLQRLGELIVATRNTRRLRAAGGVEYGARHYPLFVGLHAAWLLTLFLLVPADADIDPVWLSIFCVLQIGRLWVVVSLGRYWTTRIISVPGAPLVEHGPYRFARHPNYVIVSGEFLSLPLVFGAWWIAIVFSVLNALLLVYRIRAEDAALAKRRRPNAGNEA